MRRISTNLIATFLIPLRRWRSSDHIATIAGVVGDLALELEDLVLHARNAQLVLVLHAAEPLLNTAYVRPNVALALRLLLACDSSSQNIPHAATRGSAVTRHASRVGA